MAQIRLILETVTPMFLAGADNRSPELRPASFRGALRFWLRALLGAQVGDDLKALRWEENQIFGSTDGASPVVVRTSARVPLTNLVKRAEGSREMERHVLPHSSTKTFTRPAWAEGGQLILTLTTRPGQTELPAEAIAALLLFLNLGGVGNRSRRGFGSLQGIQAQVEGPSEGSQLVKLLDKSLADGTDLEQHLATVLAQARSAVHSSGGSPYTGTQLPDYPILADQHAKVLLCREPFAVGHYHEAMVNFWDRLRHPTYAQKQDAFGYARPRQRRASPLILHIARSRAGHHLVMTAFRSKPEPMGRAGWLLIDQFLAERAAAWDGVYLLGGGVSW